MGKKKILWETEGERIHSSDVQDLLFVNKSVEEFIDYHNKFFIVASKGIGKTLLMKHKRYILESKYKDKSDTRVLFIPSVNPYLDFASDYGDLSQNHIAFLNDWLNTKMLWQISFQLSVICYYGAKYKNEEILNQLNFLPAEFVTFLFQYKEQNPSDILGFILNYSISEIKKNVPSWRGIINKLYQRFVQSGVFIFIDRLDQALMRYPKEIWISFQVGLIEASWDLMRLNHHVKIFCSIRQEAFNNYESQNKQAILGSVTFLQYTNEELELLLETLSNYYETSSFSEFIGFEDFKHPLTSNTEDIYEYILRHSLYRPRDLVAIANSLHPYKGQIKLDRFRRQVNETSSQHIAKPIFVENSIFLEGLQNLKVREDFLSLIPRNILSQRELMGICQSFNNESHCNVKKCLDCELCHAFSELYNLGLLGYIDKNNIHHNGILKQKFKKPHDVYGIVKGAIPVGMDAYLMHPCLNDYLKHLRNKFHGEKYQIVPTITVGDDCVWRKKDRYAFEMFLLIEAIDEIGIKDEFLEFLHGLANENKNDSSNSLKTIFNDINNTGKLISNCERIYDLGAKLIDMIE